MNSELEIYQTLLNNPTISSERRDKTLAELRAIPQSDSRFKDARALLQEFEHSEPEQVAAKYPVPSLNRWDDVLAINAAYENYQGPLESETAEMGRLLIDGSDTALAEFAERAPRYVSRSLTALHVRDFPTLKDVLLRDGWTFWIREADPALKAEHPHPAEELRIALQSDLTSRENQAAVLLNVWPRIAESATANQDLAAGLGTSLERFAAMPFIERIRNTCHSR